MGEPCVARKLLRPRWHWVLVMGVGLGGGGFETGGLRWVGGYGAGLGMEERAWLVRGERLVSMCM